MFEKHSLIALVLAIGAMNRPLTVLGYKRNLAGNQCHNCSDPSRDPCLEAPSNEPFKHCEKSVFITCEGGDRVCTENFCPGGQVWKAKKGECRCPRGLKFDGAVCAKRKCIRDLNGCNNPCPEGVSRGEYHHSFCGGVDEFVRCDNHDGCRVLPCPPGTIWSVLCNRCVHLYQDEKLCVLTRLLTAAKPMEQCVSDIDGCTNPCPEGMPKGEFYHPYCGGANQFVQCGEHDGCHVLPCPPGTAWSVLCSMCIHPYQDEGLCTPAEPTTMTPTVQPMSADTSGQPTRAVTALPTDSPINWPTDTPIHLSTQYPTALPTVVNSGFPMNPSTFSPKEPPSEYPMDTPTETPSDQPTDYPVEQPTKSPMNPPTATPTNNPTDSPTEQPTKSQINTPTNSPTEQPTKSPANSPTRTPTNSPTEQTTNSPTKTPTDSPTDIPTHDDTRSQLTFLKDNLGRDSYGKCEGKPCRNQLPYSMESNVSL